MVHVSAGGHYAIVTSSRSSGGRAVLVSLPVSAGPGDRRCLELWWSASLPWSAAVLSVQVLRHNGVLVSVAWNQPGSAVQSASGAWQQAAISLTAAGPFEVCISCISSSLSTTNYSAREFVNKVCAVALLLLVVTVQKKNECW